MKAYRVKVSIIEHVEVNAISEDEAINLAEASVQRNILFNQHEIELEIIEEFEL